MLLSRFFSLFAKGPEQVAAWINNLSALASAMTVTFLFWTITHLARKIVDGRGEPSAARILSILGAGFVGALACTFCDTFWFSAVEAEVYATSALFTAVTFWAILKWENVAGSPGANRWIILIAYFMGLSIGVHLLNLLAIPAVVMVYYFKRYKPDRKGILASLGISALLLLVLLYVIIPGIVKVAGIFERIAVNGLGMPYNSGVIIFIPVTASFLAYLIWVTQRKKRVVLNTILVSLSVVIIGYFSYGVILIRALANPRWSRMIRKPYFPCWIT